MNDVPGMQLKVRVLDESRTVPAVALGLILRDAASTIRHRIDTRSSRLACMPSSARTSDFLGYLTLHAGANYSLEKGDGDDDMNAYVGADKTIGGALSLTAEYDFGFNDNDHDARGKGRGYLNAALRWSIGSGLTISVVLQDLLQNGGTTSSPCGPSGWNTSPNSDCPLFYTVLPYPSILLHSTRLSPSPSLPDFREETAFVVLFSSIWQFVRPDSGGTRFERS